MAQTFPRYFNRLPALATILGGVVTVGAVAVVWYFFSPKYTDVGYMPEQPVPYSHKLHVGELGLDCRYCHATVETSAVANVPPTQVCMNCHRVVQRDSEKLEPIRASSSSGTPMRWVRVHKVPEYAYFEHRSHVRAGVGCVSCHGRVDEMDEVRQVEPLSMSWCLDCHRNPEPHLRPVAEVTNMRWTPPRNEAARAQQLAGLRKVSPPTDCSGCHR